MELQCPPPSFLPNRLFAPKFPPFLCRIASLWPSVGRHSKSNVRLRKQTLLLRPELRLGFRVSDRPIVSISSSSSLSKKLSSSGSEDNTVTAHDTSRLEPFQGKPGSVSFVGVTHQLVEARKPEDAQLAGKTGSFRWVIAPVALISSFVLPRFFIDITIDGLRNDVLTEALTWYITEAIFYIGVGIYLSITGEVQKPYLESGAKRWSLITGLRGYSNCALFIVGFKALVPLIALYITWPALGKTALLAVAPFMFGLLVQFAYEKHLQNCKSSCWPLVPIIFEVYRFYQLTRAIGFVQSIMFGTQKLTMTPEILLQRNGALVSLIVTFQVLGLACLWSFSSFLLSLLPRTITSP
ncbi:unnamed protein product [Cuscuta campestris]|uniref:Uncharacterized protein n=1 Tax=Cuscuta campestris TaxID=132261 RepID=A0A484KUI5_9ASTE|nr:unnamed protein product [Cuscuta campestris]